MGLAATGLTRGAARGQATLGRCLPASLALGRMPTECPFGGLAQTRCKANKAQASVRKGRAMSGGLATRIL
jgi:hypothetical protein